MDLPAQTAAVVAGIDRIRKRRNATFSLGVDVMAAAGGGSLTHFDLLTLGAIKRQVSTAEAFCLMLESWNLLGARLLARVHLDTALRYSAGWLVEDADQLASHVIGGGQINQFKDSFGKRLSDARLVEVHATEYPWLPDVYKNLSGYVHFSGQHIFACVQNLDDATNGIQFAINEQDLKFPEFSWLELISFFEECSTMLERYLDDYKASKTDQALVGPANERIERTT